jgi:catechol 2,3-dioxygenase-like lactoylglutathione lyase family enzyme
MLTEETLVAFLTTAKPRAAQAFYEGVLGLSFVIESEHMMVFESGASKVTLQKGKTASVRPGTVLGWNVKDLNAAVRTLMGRGVVFERYDMDQDELGIWSPVPGQGVAWFLDPDGNTLSVSGPI